MSILELEEKIRDRISSGRLHRDLLNRIADWNSLCSALDVVGDTELALDAYLALPDSDNAGLCYLYLYGGLQILQTQQDAVRHICRALGIKTSTKPKVDEIAEIRSDSIGHPVVGKRDKVSKSNFIVRMSLSQHRYELMTVLSDGKRLENRRVSVPELIKEQRVVIEAVLDEVMEKMNEMERKHRTKHKETRLQDVFPGVLSYYFSKVRDAISSDMHWPRGKMHLELIAACLEAFRDELEKRGEWRIYESIDYEYELLVYPLDELLQFFANPQKSKLNRQDAWIFTDFVQKHFSELEAMAKEMDERYQSDPSDSE